MDLKNILIDFLDLEKKKTLYVHIFTQAHNQFSDRLKNILKNLKNIHKKIMFWSLNELKNLRLFVF